MIVSAGQVIGMPLAQCVGPNAAHLHSLPSGETLLSVADSILASAPTLVFSARGPPETSDFLLTAATL